MLENKLLVLKIVQKITKKTLHVYQIQHQKKTLHVCIYQTLGEEAALYTLHSYAPRATRLRVVINVFSELRF